MKLKILGSGASTGVPIIACPCEICHSKNPFNKRLRSSALLTTDTGKNILIDTAPDLREQAIRFNITHIEAVLLTHAHADHVMGFDDLRAFSFRTHQTIPCYGVRATIDEMLHVFSYIFCTPPDYQGGMVAQVEFMEITQQDPFEVEGVKISPFKLIHSDAVTTGYRFGDTSYVTDCSEIPPESKEIIRGSKKIIIDALREKPHATHFSIPDAIDAAEELGAEQIYLTHLSHSIDYDKWSKILPSNAALAYDGLTLEVKY